MLDTEIVQTYEKVKWFLIVNHESLSGFLVENRALLDKLGITRQDVIDRFFELKERRTQICHPKININELTDKDIIKMLI